MTSKQHSDNPQSNLQSLIQWNEITKDSDNTILESSLPDTFVRVQIVAYNKSINRSVVATAMYEGMTVDHPRWSCLLLSLDKINWYILDKSWQVTHWSDIIVPDLIQQINKSKKIVDF